MQQSKLDTNLAESESRGRVAVATTNARANTDNLGVNSAGDAVVKLDIQLGDGIDCVQLEVSTIYNFIEFQ